MSRETKVPEEAVERLARQLLRNAGLPWSWEELERLGTGDGEYADGFRDRARSYLADAAPALRTEWEKELLSDEAVHFAWEQVLDEIQPEDVLPPTRGEERAREVIQAAISSTKKGADR